MIHIDGPKRGFRATKLAPAGFLLTAILTLALTSPIAAVAKANQPLPVITGVVLDGESGEPIAGASIATGLETISTDAAGRFSVTLASNDRVLQVVADGYLDTPIPLEPAVARAGGELEIVLFRNTFAETVQVVSAPLAPAERPSATPIAADDVFEVAGAFDNIFRTLDTLPGVASTGDFGSRLAVRGGTPDQNLTVMDGVEIHNPYRLFGLVSAFNPETVERFELTAGGFGAAYGDRLSSLLIVDNRIGERDFAGSSSASITDANLVLEGGTPGGGSWMLSVRRTYYDVVANAVSDQRLPSFGDLQMQAQWTFGPGHRLTLFGLTSRENADIQLEEEDDPGDNDRDRVFWESRNDLASLRFDALLGSAATSRTIVSWYQNTDLFQADSVSVSSRAPNASASDVPTELTDTAFSRDLSVRDLTVRQELAVSLSSAHTLDTGFELHQLSSGADLFAFGDFNNLVPGQYRTRGGAQPPENFDTTLDGRRGGAWIQDRYTVGSRLSLEPGLRLDWSSVNGDSAVSPRFAATVLLPGSSRLRVAGGLYTQSPGYEKLIQSDYFFDLSPANVSNLRHERATHFVTGFERDLGADTLFRVEGYYKRFEDLIVGRLESANELQARLARYDFPANLRNRIPGTAQITSIPENAGTGRAYGMDVYLVRSNRSARLAGWISYAWGHADRETYGLIYPFEYDRRHAFNAVARYRLGRNWSIATTAQVATGFPYTPAVGVNVETREDARGRLVPSRDKYGELNYTVYRGGLDALHQERLDHYARVDLRIANQPGGPSSRWSWYVEVINLLNRDNPLDLDHSLIYHPDAVPTILAEPMGGFPIIPSFGVRIRF